jgi:hypothetical protein
MENMNPNQLLFYDFPGRSSTSECRATKQIRETRGIPDSVVALSKPICKMRYYKIVLLILISIYSIPASAQSKCLGVGVNTGFFSSWNPGVSLMPYLFCQYKKHELLAGAELYDGQYGFASIIGAEAEYRYHFYNIGSRFNLFADCNFQYVKYAIGPVQAVPYSYINSPNTGADYSAIRVRSFNNTLGAGIQYSFCEILSAYINIGGGYGYHRNTASPAVYPSPTDPDFLRSGFEFSYMFKLGLAIKLIRSKE